MGAFVVSAIKRVKGSMPVLSQKMGLTVWTGLQDPYNHDQLANNWFKVDQHDHSQGRGVQIPTGGIQDGAITKPKIDPDLYNELSAVAPEGFLMPAGAVITYAGSVSTPPSGWLVCDGSSVSREQYPSLFAAIGTHYGSTDSDTFKLPNAQNRVVVGVSNTKARGATGGVETVTLNISQIPSHNHGTWTGFNSPQLWTIREDGAANGAAAVPIGGSIPNGQYGAILTSLSNHRHQIASEGGGQAHDNMQPYIALFYLIKT